MFVFLNGEFVPEERALVSVFDRSFLYGDGLFETIRVLQGTPFRWAQHFARLENGATFLGIDTPINSADLLAAARELIAQNQMPECLLRLTLSRGVGVRGYSPKGAQQPILVMSLHAASVVDPANPPRWRLVTSSLRLPANQPLAQFKTCNKLAQILARAEADAQDADEALLLNTDGAVVEGASSNLFWVKGRAVWTPPLASGVLAGVTRAVTLELCHRAGIETLEGNVSPEELQTADAIFLSLSTVGIAEAISLDAKPVAHSELVPRLSRDYWELARNECR